MQRAVDLLEVERLRRLAEMDRRRLYARDGHLSAASWLATEHKVSWGTAREHVRIARALEEMPETRRALESGDISMSTVRVLATARDADPSAFERSEPQLVEAARIHSMRDLQRVASYWRQGVERERALDGEDTLRARRRLHASVSFLGMVRVDGDLDPETGETLLTALRAVLDAESRSRGDDDDRSPAQRRADALGEICRQWLASSEPPSVAGERPHVTVTVGAGAMHSAACAPGGAVAIEAAADPSQLGGGDDRSPSELDHIGPVDREVARRLACDASLMRVVLRGRSEPLDVGRRTPVVSPAIRRAVIIRDQHCRFPGCDRPQACATRTMSCTGRTAERRGYQTSCCCAVVTTAWSTAGTASDWLWKTDDQCSVDPMGRGSKIARLPDLKGLMNLYSGHPTGTRDLSDTRRCEACSLDQPTEPSIWSSMSRFSSTAYSMGSSRVMGSMNPFTIIAVASTSVSPRLRR